MEPYGQGVPHIQDVFGPQPVRASPHAFSASGACVTLNLFEVSAPVRGEHTHQDDPVSVG